MKGGIYVLRYKGIKCYIHGYKSQKVEGPFKQSGSRRSWDNGRRREKKASRQLCRSRRQGENDPIKGNCVACKRGHASF
jgi:hypothetical protein